MRFVAYLVIIWPTGLPDLGNEFAATNLKTAVVQTRDYGTRRLYAVESPEVWFEDFGAAKLSNGTVTVKMDPVFVQTVSAEATYHVFLSPLGDTPGLYVAEKAGDHFVVKEAQGGDSSIAFDYRIIAKRLGYEEVRLEQSDIPAPSGNLTKTAPEAEASLAKVSSAAAGPFSLIWPILLGASLFGMVVGAGSWAAWCSRDKAA